jgi:hypothetical protein
VVGTREITDTELPRMLVTSARVPSLPEVNVNGRRGSPVLVVGGRNC